MGVVALAVVASVVGVALVALRSVVPMVVVRLSFAAPMAVVRLLSVAPVMAATVAAITGEVGMVWGYGYPYGAAALGAVTAAALYGGYGYGGFMVMADMAIRITIKRATMWHRHAAMWSVT